MNQNTIMTGNGKMFGKNNDFIYLYIYNFQIKNENNNKTIDPIKEEYKNRSYLKVASFLKEQNKDWDNKVL